MQSNLATLAKERRGHDRVQDAVYLQVVPQSQQSSVLQMLQDISTRPDSPTHKVSLSAGGVTFAYGGLFPAGTQITLALVLFPSQVAIMCDATVVSTGDAHGVAKGDLPTYRAEFIDLPVEGAELIEKHVDGLLSVLPGIA